MIWDERFMDMARLVASWSKDPSTGCGAVIVDPERRVVSLGFNGLPARIEDDPAWLSDRGIKLRVVLHAEDNAINFARRDLTGCTLYVWPMPPCAQCASRLIQAGIVRAVSIRPDAARLARWGADFDLAADMYRQAGVRQDLLEDRT